MFKKTLFVIAMVVIVVSSLFCMEINLSKDFNSKYKVHRKKKVVFNSFPNDITISLTNTDLKIVPCKDNDAYFMIDYYEYEKDDVSFGISDKTFFTKTKSKKDCSLSSIIAYIPENTLIDSRTVSGDLYISNMMSNSIKIISVSGDIFVEELTNLDRARISSTSGDIHLLNCRNISDLKMDTVSGDIKINQVNAKRSEFDTTSGDLNCLDSSLNSINFKSVSGEIGFTKCQISDFSGDTVSGDLILDNTKISTKHFSSVSGDEIIRN